MKNCSFSVIIPAHNEEAFIKKCITKVRESFSYLLAEYSDCELEIIVVLNRCTDKTKEIALKNNCKILENSDKNLSKIRNAGAAIATGEILLTIDADSLMSKNLFLKVYKSISSGKYLGGGVMIFPERLSLGIILTGLYLVPFVIFYGITGGVFFVKRDAFKAINGFNEEWLSAEDIDFARRLKAYAKSKGKSFKNLYSAHIITSCRKFDRFGDWFFVLRPFLVLRLLKSRSKEDADKIWYDFNS